MNPVEQLISRFQDLVAQVPDLVQPLIVLLAGAVPFVEGEGGAVVGVLGGLHPVVAAVAAGTGNLLCVLGVVVLTSRARAAVVTRRSDRVAVGAGAAAPEGEEGTNLAAPAGAGAKPKSNGRQRFDRWLVRFGVPGASLLGPLAVPTPFTAALLVGSGTPRGWVLLWQAVAIVLWTTVATVSAWLALQVVTLV
ncbi:hypothetical protein [Desertihabitans brevis]|uniref:hypothetical protein n=1 Tax=Desertihabitans brevis TaxID=2268447 RepID=UPI0018F38155|nr:hypothetical protein [Desertihabitans brevis]